MDVLPVQDVLCGSDLLKKHKEDHMKGLKMAEKLTKRKK